MWLLSALKAELEYVSRDLKVVAESEVHGGKEKSERRKEKKVLRNIAPASFSFLLSQILFIKHLLYELRNNFSISLSCKLL